MTTTRKRSRRDRAGGSGAAPHGQPAAQPGVLPLPTWHWRTFPVFFAFSLALFIGVYAGLLAAAANDAGNSSVSLLVAGIPAVMLGLGLSRLMLRFLMSHGVIKPRAKRK